MKENKNLNFAELRGQKKSDCLQHTQLSQSSIGHVRERQHSPVYQGQSGITCVCGTRLRNATSLILPSSKNSWTIDPHPAQTQRMERVASSHIRDFPHGGRVELLVVTRIAQDYEAFSLFVA
jgi:hypothetical protein